MRNAFIQALTIEAKINKKIFLLTGDLGYRYLEPFRDSFPDRFLNVGVAESNLVCIAAGLAAEGYEPYIYSIATFASLRAYEQIRNLIILQELNVKIVGTGGGLAYAEAGVTHHSQEDIAAMRLLPHMDIVAPSSPKELLSLGPEIFRHKGSMYIRLERNPQNNDYMQKNYSFGKGYIIQQGKLLALLTTGTKWELAKKIAAELQTKDIHPTIACFPFISPLDSELLNKLFSTHGYIVTLEEHRITGGFGSAIKDFSFSNNLIHKNILSLGLQDTFASISAGYQSLINYHHLDITSSLKKINQFIKI